ncbi:hypothetical protein RCH18_002172 [Flavobacterium sp. PL11]|uniref:hypothetical protein n=1 Tax=Flavobacterium sp. PL11 TaxID=3071717 RepID=UPI002DFCAAC4|nr:hypothetical protein [Flavobacterium sp. PL11]
MKNFFKKIANLPALKTNRKLIIFLSDDWGSVRMRSSKHQKQLEANGLRISSRFDQFDTLESNADMEGLYEVLLKHKDCKENNPIITAVSNVANPDFKRIQQENFQNYHFESIDKTYQRYPDSNKVLELVKQGIEQNIFIPQSHGREHLQVNWWMKDLKDENSFARKAFENEFFFLGADYLNDPKRGRGIGAAFDIWDEEDILSSKEIVKSGLTIFKNLYGYNSKIFTPPAMFYNPGIESNLVENGIDWLDVGRFFKIPLVNGKQRAQFNYLGRKKKSGLKVLVRNAVFEANMSANDNGVARCMYDIEQAFQSKQPALISNHRASFVGGIDANNRDTGLKSLDVLLKSILKKWPDAEFLAGSEL